MDRGAAVLLTAAVGGLIALQAPINSGLGRSVGTFQAAFFVVAATITGQLTMSVVIDRFGWLGVDRKPITLAQITGPALLAAGTYLVIRE